MSSNTSTIQQNFLRSRYDTRILPEYTPEMLARQASLED